MIAQSFHCLLPKCEYLVWSHMEKCRGQCCIARIREPRVGKEEQVDSWGLQACLATLMSLKPMEDTSKNKQIISIKASGSWGITPKIDHCLPRVPIHTAHIDAPVHTQTPMYVSTHTPGHTHMCTCTIYFTIPKPSNQLCANKNMEKYPCPTGAFVHKD